jgi:hypothetical protein
MSAAPKATGVTAAGGISTRVRRSQPFDTRNSGTEPRIKVFLGELPVEALLEHGLHIALALIAVVDVVGVLPDVHGQQATHAVRHRRVRVGGGDDLQLSVLVDEPRPAAAELTSGGGAELLEEALIGAEVALEAPAQRRRGRRRVGRERVPVKIVVPRLRGVVEKLALARAHDIFQG